MESHARARIDATLTVECPVGMARREEGAMRGVLWSIAATALICACSKGSVSGGTPPEEGQAVGPTGGTLTFPNGVQLTVPPGAVAARTTVSVRDLPAAEIDAVLASTAIQASRARRFLGGFSAEPEGLVFQAPVRASIPVRRLDPYELPVPITVRLAEGTYRFDSSELVHGGAPGKVELDLWHFSDVVVGGLSGPEFEARCTACESYQDAVCEAFDPLQPACCLLAPARRTAATCPSAAGCDCCREGRIHVVTSAVEVQAGACVLLSDDVQVTFLDCPGTPTETSSLTDRSSEDLTFELSLHPSAMDLPVKEVERFSATATCRRGAETLLEGFEVMPIWTSEAPAVASFVDLLGGIRSNATSPWPITVRANLGASSGVGAAADVSVFCPGCTLEIVPSSKVLAPGESLRLTAVVRDAQGAPVQVLPETLSWTSSDPGVASLAAAMGESVQLQAHVVGSTTVSAEYRDVKEQAGAQASITVREPVDVHVYLSRIGSKVLCPGRAVQFEAEVVDAATGLPYGGCPVEWSTSDPLVASVSGGLVTAHSPGRANITATCSQARRTDSVKVVFNDEAAGQLGHRCFLVTVTGMTLDSNYPGESCALVASEGTAPVSGRSLGMTGTGSLIRVMRPPNAASGAEAGYALFDSAGLHDMFTESYNPYYPDDYAHLHNIRRNWTASLEPDGCEFKGYYDWSFYGPMDSCAGRNEVVLTPVDFILEGGDPFYVCE